MFAVANDFLRQTSQGWSRRSGSLILLGETVDGNVAERMPLPCLLDYMIASTQRTGSGYFCELLQKVSDTGRVGEYLSQASIERRQAQNGTSERESIIDLIKEAAPSDGRGGVKIHYRDFIRILAHFEIGEILPKKVILVRRRDRLAQAISLVRARQTGAWTSQFTEQNAPRYVYAALLDAWNEICNDELNWSTLLQFSGRETHVVFYEELFADPECVLDAALAALNKPRLNHIDPSGVARRVQRDELNDDWRHRFAEDYLRRLSGAGD